MRTRRRQVVSSLQSARGLRRARRGLPPIVSGIVWGIVLASAALVADTASGGVARLAGSAGSYVAGLIPDAVPAAELTVFEPLANGVNWVSVAGVQPGESVVVQGPGHQGLAVLEAALLLASIAFSRRP